MQQRKRKMPVRFMAFGFASMLLLNGMTIDTQAKESKGLPSAGVDFFIWHPKEQALRTYRMKRTIPSAITVFRKLPGRK